MTEEIIQGSDPWKQLRLGRVTASRFADIPAKDFDRAIAALNKKRKG